MTRRRREISTLYQENASIYAAPPRDVTSDLRFSVVRPLIMEEHPSAVLDIGCGRGEFLGGLPTSMRRSGIDSLPSEQVLPGIEYVQNDIAQGFPWDDAQFDALFAGEIIEHLLDTVAFLKECRRVLRPTGVLVLTTPNLAYWRNLLQWMRQQQFFFVDHRAGETGHVRYFAPRTLQAVLVEAGFSVEQLFSAGDLPTSGHPVLRGIGRVVDRVFALRSLSLIAKARRANHQQVSTIHSDGAVASPHVDENAPGCR